MRLHSHCCLFTLRSCNAPFFQYYYLPINLPTSFFDMRFRMNEIRVFGRRSYIECLIGLSMLNKQLNGFVIYACVPNKKNSFFISGDFGRGANSLDLVFKALLRHFSLSTWHRLLFSSSLSAAPPVSIQFRRKQTRANCVQLKNRFSFGEDKTIVFQKQSENSKHTKQDNINVSFLIWSFVYIWQPQHFRIWRRWCTSSSIYDLKADLKTLVPYWLRIKCLRWCTKAQLRIALQLRWFGLACCVWVGGG